MRVRRVKPPDATNPLRISLTATISKNIHTRVSSMTCELTTGALLSIMRQEKIWEPHLQVLKIRKINTYQDRNRLRLLLSDGNYLFGQVVLTTNLCIEKFSVIKVKNYNVSITEVGKLYCLLIHEAEVVTLGSAVRQKIGDPKVLTDELTTLPKNQEQVFSDNVAVAPSSQQDISSGATTENIFSASDSRQITEFCLCKDNEVATAAANNISPIDSLSPYRRKWVIKARVSSKSEMIPFRSSNGKFFKVNFVDNSGEIMCTAFNQSAQRYFDYLQEGKIYFVSNCKVSLTDYEFTKNPYEIEITAATTIEECLDDTDSVPLYPKYNFTTLDKINALNISSTIDVLGVCERSFDVETVRSPRSESKKRKIVLVDRSRSSVPVILWGSQAESFDGTHNPVVAIKRARVEEFQGCRNLSVSINSEVKVNPKIEECSRIRNWYNVLGRDVNFESSNFELPWMCLKEVEERRLGYSVKADYFQVFATILNVYSHNAVYKACPSSDCKKKLVDLETGKYMCGKCNKEYPNFKYYLRLNMNIADFSGNQWVTAFGEEAEKILGVKAEKLGVILENEDERAATIFEAVSFKQFIFKCRINLGNFNDEQRLQTMVLQVNLADNEKHNSHLVDQIEKIMTS